MIATDFFHVDTTLLTRVYVLVFIEHRTRRIHQASITANPDGPWTAQQTRNLAMTMGTSLDQMRFLLRDRGSQFTTAFDAVFEDCGLRILRSPVRAEFNIRAGQGRMLGWSSHNGTRLRVSSMAWALRDDDG